MENQEKYDEAYYLNLREKYLNEAEEQFGERTDYEFIGLVFEGTDPKTEPPEISALFKEKEFLVYLTPVVKICRDEGIFQLSHEVVHLLSPVLLEDHEEISYLEEGMAVHFSKLITGRDTGNMEIVERGLNRKPLYRTAYQLYLELIRDEPDAIRKLRVFQKDICRITPGDFKRAGLKTSPELIEKLLAHFPRH